MDEINSNDENRGKKRNRRDLLSTDDNNDPIDPRPRKKQRLFKHTNEQNTDQNTIPKSSTTYEFKQKTNKQPISKSNEMSDKSKEYNTHNPINLEKGNMSFKRQKLSPNHHYKSAFFTHKLDNAQYQDIFNAIDNSQTIKSLHITHSISCNIAEFATGHFEQCVNETCNNDISILEQDYVVYDCNHENSLKIGYKWCIESNKLFCSDCMDLATTCNCGGCDTRERKDDTCRALIFSLNKCKLCMDSMAFEGANCDGAEVVCNECNDSYCADCIKCDKKIGYCFVCHEFFCDKCYLIPEEWGDDSDTVLCYACYDERTIECGTCNIKCKLLFKGNDRLFNDDIYPGEPIMVKCISKNCDVFVCLNCDAKTRNGIQYSCKEFGCSSSFCWHNHVFCNEHLGSVAMV